MPNNRKLGRPTEARNAMLKGLVTSLILHGRLETTVTRAKEVREIAEKLIASAARECDNFTSKQVTISEAAKDSKGNKVLKAKTSKNGNKYEVVERVKKTDLRQIDNPSRLAVRRNMMNVVYRVHDASGKSVNLTNKLMNEIGPKYKDRKGGYTRMYKLGPRRGDGAEMAVLELVK